MPFAAVATVLSVEGSGGARCARRSRVAAARAAVFRTAVFRTAVFRLAAFLADVFFTLRFAALFLALGFDAVFFLTVDRFADRFRVAFFAT